MEIIEMSEFKNNYSKLKNNINNENSKIVSFLIYGIFLGRLYEKFRKFKRKIRLKKWISHFKNL